MENKIIIICLFLLLSLLFSCNNETPIKEQIKTSDSLKNVEQIEIEPFKKQEVYSVGDTIILRLANVPVIESDSINLIINQQQFKNYKIIENKLLLYTSMLKAGKNYCIIKTKNKEGYYNFIIKSKKMPIQYTYKIIKRYPHDANSYTQGLIYHNGIMYEGSGQYGESMLRMYKLENGEIIQSYSLPNNVFGEGIAIYNNKIYQLTWQSHIAYEFDLNTFKLIRTFDFNTEGWGLTTYDNYLILSDGTNILYFLNPENFTEVKRIEVYDNIGPVNNLNELELIEGKIYANVYQTSYIVIIDPETGFVEGKIDLTNILDKTKLKREPDVLNGIAYDNKQKRIFVTGKYWPETYEIQLIEKK